MQASGHASRGNGLEPRRRPRLFALGAVAGTAAHHGFELASGVGLVWQPELGLGRAATLWTVQLGSWAALATRGQRRADPVLAALAGASLAGVAVHFVLWPWERGRVGLPRLTAAEGLSAWQMPTYNTILRAWALASAGAIVFDTPPGSRRWALVGGASLPVFVASARHHFEWIKLQAASDPAWWNRGVALDEPTA
jgi:hypothetical protein